MHIRARDIELNNRHAWGFIHRFGKLNIVFDRVARDGSNDGGGHRCNLRGNIFDKPFKPRISKPNGIEHPATRPGDAWKWIALARFLGEGFCDDGPNAIELHHIIHLVEHTSGARSEDNRIAQVDTGERCAQAVRLAHT